MGSKNDIYKYPVFRYQNGKLIPVKVGSFPLLWNIWQEQCHHFVPQQLIKRKPELEKYQKLIFLPVRVMINGVEHNMHAELHNNHRDFEKNYGISRKELLWE